VTDFNLNEYTGKDYSPVYCWCSTFCPSFFSFILFSKNEHWLHSQSS
jgi:hypothetical protein